MIAKLIDANVFVRFLIGDGGHLYKKSCDIMTSIENGEIRVKLCEPVLAEVVYVLLKVYQVEKHDIRDSLINIFKMKNIVMDNKAVAQHALRLFESENIDFVDALLLAYQINTDAVIITFDKKLNKYHRS